MKRLNIVCFLIIGLCCSLINTNSIEMSRNVYGSVICNKPVDYRKGIAKDWFQLPDSLRASVKKTFNFKKDPHLFYRTIFLPKGIYRISLNESLSGWTNSDEATIYMVNRADFISCPERFRRGDVMNQLLLQQVFSAKCNQEQTFYSTGDSLNILVSYSAKAPVSSFLSRLNFTSVVLPDYSNGFESTDVASDFQVTTSQTGVSQWVVGTATANSGTKSLYVSADAGISAGYNPNIAGVTIAYVNVLLPVGKQYSVTFDYKYEGEGNNDLLYVCQLNDTSKVIDPNQLSGALSWLSASSVMNLSRCTSWRNFAFTIIGTGAVQRIAFLWKNDGNNQGTMPGGCVDNFYIRALTPLNYFCGFDDSVENTQWKLNNSALCVNQWVIGKAAFNHYPQGLFISSDQGLSAYYTNSAGCVTAAREFILPANTICDVTFDWQCFGEKGGDELYVCWLTDTTEIVGAYANSSIPAWVQNTVQQVNPSISGGTKMIFSSNWQTGTFVVNGNGRPARMVFVWHNNESNTFTPAAMIDNIQITTRRCARVTNLQANVDSLNQIVVTWDDNPSNDYTVSYNNASYHKDGPWTVLNHQTSPCVLTNLSNGRYTIWVQNMCDTALSSQGQIARLNGILVYENEGCIDFSNLKDTSVVTPTVGYYDNPYFSKILVDYGQYSALSRHTVNYYCGRDYYTNNKLPIIPDDEMVSVRLGNSNVNGETESLSYSYIVDPLKPIVLLKYAVVLENPNHINPSLFQLEILDQYNRLIDPLCGAALFLPGQTFEDWNVDTVDGKEINWKDWSLLGLNLKQYIGQLIKIRFTTKDCKYGGHFGYAYLVMDCSKGTLEGLACNSDMDTLSNWCAPKGFNYRWYALNQPQTTISTDRCFQPLDNDTGTYICEVISRTEAACTFNLVASLKPRYPLAMFAYRDLNDKCTNMVQFNNASAIYTNDGLDSTIQLNSFQWDFDNGLTSCDKDPLIDFGTDGGTYNVRLIVGVDNGWCVDTTYLKVVLPARPKLFVQDKKTICLGQTYNFNGTLLFNPGIYSDTLLNTNGCDSVVELTLQVEKLYEHFDTLTICQGDTVKLGHLLLFDSGFYSDTLASVSGCDSIVNLLLHVNPVVSLEVYDIPQVCEDDASFVVSYDVIGKISPSDYSVYFDDAAKKQGFVDQIAQHADNGVTISLPASVRANVYHARLEWNDDIYNCKPFIYPFTFQVCYSQTVIKQLWNDVLGLKNLDYNGGYDFVSYQWYCNGNPIPGATAANYYVRHGDLDFTADYQALIRRSDGVELFTCPFRPVRLADDINSSPIIVNGISFNMIASQPGVASLYALSGQFITSWTIESGNNVIEMHYPVGIYLLKILFKNGEIMTKRLVIVDE